MLLAIVASGVIGAALWVAVVRPPIAVVRIPPDQGRADCDSRYRHARTAADTAIVDRVDVGAKYRRVLCEDYRLNRRGTFPAAPHRSTGPGR